MRYHCRLGPERPWSFIYIWRRDRAEFSRKAQLFPHCAGPPGRRGRIPVLSEKTGELCLCRLGETFPPRTFHKWAFKSSFNSGVLRVHGIVIGFALERDVCVSLRVIRCFFCRCFCPILTLYGGNEFRTEIKSENIYLYC